MEAIKEKLKIKQELILNYRHVNSDLEEKSFIELKENGELLAGFCFNCKKLFFPILLNCGFCNIPIKELKKVEPSGVLQSYTLLYLNKFTERLKEPLILGLIKLKGTYGTFYHYLKIPLDFLKINLEIKAVFKEKEKRKGNLTDIKYFII